MNLQSPVWRPLLRTVLTRAAMVHTVSDQLAATAAKEFGVPVDKCLVLTQGVDTKLFSYRVPRSENVTMRLLCTRSLNTVYDPLTILGACRRLKELGVSFEMTFAAGGPLQPEMEEVAARMQLSDCVRFIGGFRNEDLPSLLAMHDLYLSASLWDGTSISLLEAMSVGVLPIVSRIPSNHAWLEDGRTALMFDCGNIEELAQQLQRAAANLELRRTAAIENRRIVQSCADRWTNMARLEQMYYDVTDACAGSLTFPQAGST
jgi:glycosyltransferase involved in cell wall biosynthesis